tara:strand:+ start:109 stop:441 length:333 start_codon:yes stop_codon:yes gene_type:complete
MPNLEEKDFHLERNNDEWRQATTELLKTGYGRFTFQKVDGSIRVMRCTLMPAILPETNKELRANARPGVATLFDVEVNEWRSLKYDNVLQFIFLGDSPNDPEKESTWTQV